MNGLVYVNGNQLNNVNGYTVSWYDVSKDSGRDTTSADGTMILNVINQKYRLDLQTTYMNQQQMESFFSQIKTNSTMTVNFFDPYTGGRKTCNMYRGDRSVTLRYKLQNGSIMYEPVSIALIEL